MAEGFSTIPEENITEKFENQRADLDKYLTFVDGVTSQESKDTATFVERILTLQAEGADPQRLLTAAIGLSAEAGEFAEIVKKIAFQGKPYNEDNIEHMKIELGDCLWYVAQACIALDVQMDDLVIRNVEKLIKRYPGGEFDVVRSENRAADDR